MDTERYELDALLHLSHFGAVEIHVVEVRGLVQRAKELSNDLVVQALTLENDVFPAGLEGRPRGWGCAACLVMFIRCFSAQGFAC